MADDFSSSSTLTYEASGVDIEAGNALIRRIAPLARRTHRTGSMDGLGGFGGLFDLKACGYDDPILVSATDGVGTKLKLAFEVDHHDTVGIDLVAMCVNDLLVQAAEPLFFLDYFATGALNTEQAARVIAGIAKGCLQAGCQLIGGETAEMPGMYAEGEYDLAGFAVGAVERSAMLPQKEAMQVDDVLLALPSSGLHSNGFSLLRKLVAAEGLNWQDAMPGAAGTSLAALCLEPTRIYIRSLLKLAQTGQVKGLAHITGGGLSENLPRILPEGLAAEIDLQDWQWPAIYDWIWRTGRIEQAEMLRTFNCGVGMVLVVSAATASRVMEALREQGEAVRVIGRLVARGDDAPVHYLGSFV